MAKKSDSFKPTRGMIAEAKRGLAWRKEHNRGGTQVGVSRARDIVNGKALSYKTVTRMKSFFARHEVDKQGKGFDKGEDGYPSAGRIAWALWGGDAGKSWSEAIVRRVENYLMRTALIVCFSKLHHTILYTFSFGTASCRKFFPSRCKLFLCRLEGQHRQCSLRTFRRHDYYKASLL